MKVIPTDAKRGRAREGTDAHAHMVDRIRYYLALEPPQIPSEYLYDALGSSLFDAICELPWYPITRAELRLIADRAAEIARTVGVPARVVELGSGNGDKLARLLGGFPPAAVEVVLIDVSDKALERSARAVRGVSDIPLTLHQATYEAGLMELLPWPGGRTMVAFLGSNLGNFDPPGAEAFLGVLRSALGPGDCLLLGADLVKPERDLLLAYNDPLGVTAAFNRNLLVRLNRELDAAFDIREFAHQARWNAGASRVEMYLVCRREQVVEIPRAGLRLALAAGDAIWTESSYKYEPEGIRSLVEGRGFRLRHQWTDDVDRFELALFEAV